jgi:flagellar biosynthesis protein FlhF
MMTKNYRAATMREALEKVKQEMGEEALVLDSRRVRAGGFLGLGSTELIEVRVAASDAGEEEPRPKRETTQKQAIKSGLTSLNLSDDTLAAPVFAAIEDNDERKASQIFATLAARTYSNKATTPATLLTERAQKNDAAPLIGVEVATTAPRIVHRKSTAMPVTEDSPSSSSATPQAQSNRASSDYERLRAELREVKFALGAFGSRAIAAVNLQTAHTALAANDEVYDSPYYEAYLELAATGLDPATARRIIGASLSLKRKASEQPVEVAREALRDALPTLVQFGDDPLGIKSISAQNHTVMALIGPTGVGKTTTLAKLAARVGLRERRRVELITLDTYRIAAVEQLKTYAEIIGAGFHVPRSLLELDSLVRRFSPEATVLIDTIGRSPNDLADQMELADYLRFNEEILKCLVLQATTHPTDAQVASKKFALFGSDCLAITKLDETTRPGASISLATDAGLPLIYLCAGQRVPEDIEGATAAAFTTRVLRSNAIALAA